MIGKKTFWWLWWWIRVVSSVARIFNFFTYNKRAFCFEFALYVSCMLNIFFQTIIVMVLVSDLFLLLLKLIFSLLSSAEAKNANAKSKLNHVLPNNSTIFFTCLVSLSSPSFLEQRQKIFSSYNRFFFFFFFLFTSWASFIQFLVFLLDSSEDPLLLVQFQLSKLAGSQL